MANILMWNAGGSSKKAEFANNVLKYDLAVITKTMLGHDNPLYISGFETYKN